MCHETDINKGYLDRLTGDFDLYFKGFVSVFQIILFKKYVFVFFQITPEAGLTLTGVRRLKDILCHLTGASGVN
jgi:hypothetical protein